MAKVMLSIDDDLLKEIDEDASLRYMSRSGLVSYVMSQYLLGQRGIKALSDLNEQGTLDEDTSRKIDMLITLMQKK